MTDVRRTFLRYAGQVRRLAIAAPLVLLGACSRMTNFVTTPGPEYEGRYARPASAREAEGTPIRVVSFNIQFSREIDRALTVLESDCLRGADVVALQEMDTVAVERIARTLGLNYAYYPASIHPASGKYFGPAVLSRWPIERSWKVVLPHGGWTRGQRRTATAAVVRIGATPLLVYAVHLETPLQITDRERQDQAMAIVRDAASHPGPVVIAGDFNSQSIGPFIRHQGYRWQTERVGRTVAWFSWDHIFTRGLPGVRPASAGVIADNKQASDHHPVWAVVAAPAPAAVATGL
jgi:endonuclease/exonuclease/phosphatase family metal-dependent hydrolase